MSIPTYKTYRFIDKDPIIDVIRSAIQESGETYTSVAIGSGVGRGSIYNWLHKGVRRPQNASTTAVLNYLETDTHKFKHCVVKVDKKTGKVTIYDDRLTVAAEKRLIKAKRRNGHDKE